MLDGLDQEGYIIIADKRFSGEEFDHQMTARTPGSRDPTATRAATLRGPLGPIRQWIESTVWTCKGQFALERNGDYNQSP